eukprot:2791275-Amphidinium_carterae.1
MKSLMVVQLRGYFASAAVLQQLACRLDVLPAAAFILAMNLAQSEGRSSFASDVRLWLPRTLSPT